MTSINFNADAFSSMAKRAVHAIDMLVKFDGAETAMTFGEERLRRTRKYLVEATDVCDFFLSIHDITVELETAYFIMRLMEAHKTKNYPAIHENAKEEQHEV